MAKTLESRAAPARLAGLLALARGSAAYRALDAALAEGRSVVLSEAAPGARAYLWSALVAEAGRSLCVIVPNEDRARRWRSELAGWLGDERVLAFPELETMPYELGAPSRARVHARLQALWRLSRADAPSAVVVSLRALLQPTLTPDALAGRARSFGVGDRIDWNEVAEWLFAIGYEPVVEVTEPGTFSRRGGILDVFPGTDERPARIELVGDTVESLRRFDPLTQRSDPAAVEEVVVLPAREIALGGMAAAAARLEAEGWDALPRSEELAPWRSLLEHLRSESYAEGAEALAPLLGAPASLLDHLGQAARLVFEETPELELVHDALEDEAEDRRSSLAEGGLPVAALPPAYLARSRLDGAARDRGSVRLSGAGAPLRLGWGPATSFAGRLDAYLREVAAGGGARRVVATPQAQRLSELLEERDVLAAAREDLAEAPAPGELVLLRVPLAEGFAAPDLDLEVTTDAEIFGFLKARHPERRARRRGFTAPMDLKPGDYVVHEEWGLARFEDFSTREVAGVEREYLELQFAGTDHVSLPTERIDRITRYVGGTPAGLSKLGGRDWLVAKRKVKRAVLDIARELLRIYAARELVQGHGFAPDSPWQIELENAFPYVETPDQLHVVDDVKRDMERARPMDRLIAGDVGYGKTEVALRAAFKAVLDGRQVAVLVPTTVLALQHFETFKERLATFPVRVEMLSRLRPTVEQREVLAGLETGEVDIVIGTHRLLQRDVRFRSLGLVVIDEEHRFGVRHKERLKELRTEVDVLTMTATPIPRTLHLALSGVRDISVIETPPENRQPIETKIVEYSDHVVREALLRELDRGGQVYFVHNRVEGIEQVKRRLERLVPSARYAIGHGRMDERALERVMTEFSAGGHDVLVCTTIIESGLDIPNVNTIVVNRAGSFGLAQLYQLRGRVGRSAEKAYAYLLYNRQERLTQEARARLQALFEASELGSGFRIAMHDLEIRGAGNLLGAEQHGHVAAVGFELYTQLLQEAIEELRTGGAYRAPTPAPSVSLDLALPTAIPDTYVPSRARKLELYRRIAGLRELDDLRALGEELRDRYGVPPEPVRNLLFGVEVKLRALRAGVADVRARRSELRLQLRRDIRLDERGRIERAFPKLLVGHRQIRGALPPKGDWRDALSRVLAELAA